MYFIRVSFRIELNWVIICVPHLMLMACLTPCLYIWVENALLGDSELEKDVPLDRVRVRSPRQV